MISSAIQAYKHPLTFLWLASVFASLLGFLFTFFANATLTLEDMGNLSLYIQFVTIASIGSVSLGIATNSLAAESKHSSSAQSFLLLSVLFGCILSFLYMLGSVWWMPFFNFELMFHPLVLSSMVFFIMYPLAWLRGYMHAHALFIESGIVLLIESVVKALLVYLFFSYQLSLSWFMLSLPLSAGVALCLSLFFSRNILLFNVPISVDLKSDDLLFLIQTFFSRIAIVLLLSLDLLLAKHYLSTDEAGVYALLSIVGKMIYFATQSMYTMLTPVLSLPRLSNLDKRVSMHVMILLTACVSIALVSLFSLAPRASLGLLLADRYVLILPYLARYGLAISILAVMFLGSLYQVLSRNYLFTAALFIACIAEVVVISLGPVSDRCYCQSSTVDKHSGIVCVSFFSYFWIRAPIKGYLAVCRWIVVSALVFLWHIFWQKSLHFCRTGLVFFRLTLIA